MPMLMFHEEIDINSNIINSLDVNFFELVE